MPSRHHTYYLSRALHPGPNLSHYHTCYLTKAFHLGPNLSRYHNSYLSKAIHPASNLSRHIDSCHYDPSRGLKKKFPFLTCISRQTRYSIRFTPGRWQSKTLLTIDDRGSNIARSSFRLSFVANWATNDNRDLCF